MVELDPSELAIARRSERSAARPRAADRLCAPKARLADHDGDHSSLPSLGVRPHAVAPPARTDGGEPITGRRAYDVGLVGHVVPDGTALAKAREIAGRIARNGPLAVRNIKASVLAADALPEADAYTRELELGMQVMESKDAREGPKAFLEKREPNYTGT